MGGQEKVFGDIFITEELVKRVPQKTDHLWEKAAIQNLAVCMAEKPEEVLLRFVDLAMQMADGISAGLSLYEPDADPGVFRWRYLRGMLSRFEGATTPRHFSPCGVTLDENAPILSRHPERVYTWIADANVIIPEVLLVPLYLGGVEPLGTLWIVSDQEEHFDSGHARVATELASFVGLALRMVRAERRLEQSLEEQQTLTKEMRHRVMNLFAMTEGLVRLSARSATSKDDLVRTLLGRLHALAEAHALVRRSSYGGSADNSGLQLADLIRTIVQPYDHLSDGIKSRFVIAGSSISCGEHAMSGIALIIHELATNAAKYGALAHQSGSVSIRWRRRKGELVLRWVERGGPLIASPPTHEGFGATLVRTTVSKQFEGAVHYAWRTVGLTATLTVELTKLLR